MKLSIDVKKKAEQIKQENAEFDYQAAPLEVANQIWHMLSPCDRFNLSQVVQKEGGSIKGVAGLRSCVKLLSEIIEK